MTDWFKRITSLITAQDDKAPTSLQTSNEKNPIFIKQRINPPAKAPYTSEQTSKTDTLFSVSNSHVFNKRISPSSPAHAVAIPPCSTKSTSSQRVDNAMKLEGQKDDNLKALKRLRDLPRGTQVDSRIAAIENLLGEPEIFLTLKMLRWPQGVICPRCHSSNVTRRNPPANAIDKRHYYECLNCKGEGSPSDFDDYTGLPMGSLHALRQWIMCWYLIGFCSVNQIAKVLGLSVQEVMQMATKGSELAELPTEEKELAAKKRQQNVEKQSQEQNRNRSVIDTQEDYTRSESKAPLKPGYKSKK